MESRFNAVALSSGGYKAMLGLEAYLASCRVEMNLLRLIKLRASQINGCAYCIDMHWKDLRGSMRASSGFTVWMRGRSRRITRSENGRRCCGADAVTRVSQDHVPDEVYKSVSAQFTPEELADLTIAIATINAWNRVLIASRAMPGKYHAASHTTQKSQ